MINSESIGQPNLVPNSGFENYINCPVSGGQLHYSYPWFAPPLPLNSPDYFNLCSASMSIPVNYFGNQIARSPNAYAGLVTMFYPQHTFDYREYAEIELTDSLETGVTYCVSFYVSLAETSLLSVDGLGVYLSVDSIYSSQAGPLPFQPQVINPIGNIINDTLNWVRIQGNYIATGGEKFITIGNFNSDAQTSFTYNNFGTDSIAYYYIDDVSVVQGQCTVGLEEPEVKSEIKIYPNPVKDVCLITAKQFNNSTLSVYDITGRVVLTQAFSQQVKLNTAMFTPSVYIVEIKNKQGSSIKTKLIKE